MVTTFENHHYDQIIEVDEDIAENRNDGEEDQSGRLAGSCHLLQGSGIAGNQAEPNNNNNSNNLRWLDLTTTTTITVTFWPTITITITL